MADISKYVGGQLALTMRPTCFDQVIGLKKPLEIIKKKLDTGEVPRAFLLQGPYGCGKTTLAHIIAQYIQGPFFDGDAAVQEVNAANYRKIENMRELVKTCGSYPFIGTYGVIILDECHKLTGDSQDVLLKELEVPKSPTVWILGTTDPGALNDGVRNRCFTVEVKGMEADERHDLIMRAAGVKSYTDADAITAYEKAITKFNVVSPRIILAGFEQLVLGHSPEDAVALVSITITPEYHDIGFAVCFGSWSQPTVWSGKQVAKPLGQLLYELDEKLKKKPAVSADAEEKDSVVDDSDIQDSKPEASHALRAVVGAFIKGQCIPKMVKGVLKYKTPFEIDRAVRAMNVLSNYCDPSIYELQWSGLLVTLVKVNKIMSEREK
jgi:hypothetical protein